jgi:hypothetical protein
LAGAAPFVVLVLLNILDRLPVMLNARGVHSDAAVVGLQAMHLLHGETSRFLWGAGYQGSFDAAVVALVFLILGATPAALMAAPFLGHLTLTWFAWATCRRHTSPWLAALLCLPLVFTPRAINDVVLCAPRQWCLTFLFAAIWLFDGAYASRRPQLRLGLGVTLGVVALYCDLFGLQVFAAVFLFGLLCCKDPDDLPARYRGLIGLAVGCGLGLALFFLLRSGGQASSTQATLSFTEAQLAKNWHLFRHTCLPWILGMKVWISGSNLYPDLWRPPAGVRFWQQLGGSTLVAGIGVGAWLSLASWLRGMPERAGTGLWRGLQKLVPTKPLAWPIRRLGLLGAGAAAVSILGFQVSAMPVDMWSTRYLAPIIWLAPFALLPVLARLGPKRFAVLMALYLPVAGMAGWAAYGPYVDGPWPRLDARGQAKEEQAVIDALRERGVTHAQAQYWLAYRLTFLSQEYPIVVPFVGDRYPPYFEGFAAATRVAYIFHPSEPRAVPEDVLPMLWAEGGGLEDLSVADWRILVYDRPR